MRGGVGGGGKTRPQGGQPVRHFNRASASFFAFLLSAVPAIASETDDKLPPFSLDVAKTLTTFRTAPFSAAHVAQGDWPFTVSEGEVACFDFMDKRWAVFSATDNGDKGFVLMPDPVSIFTMSLENPGLLKPFPGFEELIRRIARTREAALAACEKDGRGMFDDVSGDGSEPALPADEE
ncbi:MAG TPA: hypothetical protein PKE65_05915 [Rhizobiaceae bacterium]|nr:hypothetical protein [Rhizobiaceae bacterium]